MTTAKELDAFRSRDEEAIFFDLGQLVLKSSRNTPKMQLLAASSMSFDAVSPDQVGKRFWEEFQAAAAENICSEKDGLVKITEQSELEKTLSVIISSLLIVKFGSMGGVLASIAAALVILVIKTGIEAFCSYKEQEA